MSIDFNFIKSVLREYDQESKTAINNIIIKECQLDGVEVNQPYTDLAYTYKAIARLALGDSLSEKVGGVSRSRNNAKELSEQYEKKYFDILKKNGIFIESDGTNHPALPTIV